MNIISKESPFPHIIIDNVFDKKELELIWNELIFLAPKMRAAEDNQTGTAKNERGIPKKTGVGVMLDAFFTDQQNSDILIYAKKILQVETMVEADKLGIYFNLLKKIQRGTTLVQMYRNGDYYDPHEDFFVFTSVILLHKEPKKYHGGELNFPNFDYCPSLKNNQCIIFPSSVLHEVTEVNSDSKFTEDARFTITQFLAL